MRLRGIGEVQPVWATAVGCSWLVGGWWREVIPAILFDRLALSPAGLSSTSQPPEHKAEDTTTVQTSASRQQASDFPLLLDLPFVHPI